MALSYLATLPSRPNDLQVRLLLEEVPQDVREFFDRTWLSVAYPSIYIDILYQLSSQLLEQKAEETSKIKEMLRVLVLTYNNQQRKN
ncbi:hypothetical protein BDV97DRAFT_402142 [Delphinella strobiligena]|nr:hypothetical protein BDV97DRAFT_402142 [Delphinella strobiligena]